MKRQVAAGVLAATVAFLTMPAGPAWAQVNVFALDQLLATIASQLQAQLVQLNAQLSNTSNQQQVAALNAEIATINANLQAMASEQSEDVFKTSQREQRRRTIISMILPSLSFGLERGPSALMAAMSCPVFEGDGTRLGEDGCVWTKLTGQRTSQYGTDTNSAGFRLGGQKEVASNWFLGGALGAESSWMQAGSGVSNHGQAFDGSITLKHVMGPWLFAGAMMLGGGTTHTTRPSASGAMQSDANVFQGGARLRGAYDFAFAGWYARPRLDLDAYYTSQASVQEYGPSPVGLAVNGFQKISLAIAPTLEVGGRARIGTAILRPYVAAGAVFLPDNVWKVDVGFTGLLAQFGTVRTVFNGPSVLGTFEAGLQLYKAHGLEMKADYRLSAGTDYLSQSIGLRGAWHF